MSDIKVVYAWYIFRVTNGLSVFNLVILLGHVFNIGSRSGTCLIACAMVICGYFTKQLFIRYFSPAANDI